MISTRFCDGTGRHGERRSLDVMRLRNLISDARYACGIQLIKGVVAMLTKMF